METCKIPLRDRSGNVVEYALVSHQDFERVNAYKWHIFRSKKDNGLTSYLKLYVKSNGVEGKSTLLHGFILGKAPDGMVIDHINGDGLDNTRTNLRFLTHSQNSQNKAKKEGTTSKYKGVMFDKNISKWTARVQRQHLGVFDTEKEAAKMYDRGALYFFGETALLNGLLTEEEKMNAVSSIQHMLSAKERALPRGVYEKYGKYVPNIKIDGKQVILGRFDTAEQAIECRKVKEEELRKKLQEDIDNRDIQRNEEGVAVLPINNRQGRALYVKVDDEDWHRLSIAAVCLDPDGYPGLKIKGKLVKVHKLLVDGDLVDHINNDKLDARKRNLRISTISENAQNRTKTQGKSSKFMGVTKKRNKWKGQIVKDGTRYYLGIFKSQKEAAEAYNAKAKELYKSPKLNDIDIPEVVQA